MQDVAIDLGELRHGQLQPAEPPPRRRHRSRVPLGVVTMLLAATLTGSVHRAAPSVVTVIPARLGDTTFLTDDHYFVVSGTDGGVDSPVQHKIISGYALPSALLVSRTSVAVTGAIRRVAAVDDVLLVSYQADEFGADATAGYAAGTERSLWRRYGRLTGPAPRSGVALLHDNAPGSGATHWYGVDTRSGATRWQLDLPQNGASDLVPGTGTGPARLVSATVAGRLEVRDTYTGAVSAASTVPAPAQWRTGGLNIGVAGDLVLVGGQSGTTAYTLAGLSERWRNDVDLTAELVAPACGDVICLLGRFGGVRVLDPATGRQHWASALWSVAWRVGPNLVGTGNDQVARRPLMVVDARSGQPRGNLGDWRPAGDPRSDGSVLGLREQSRERRVWYGLLEPTLPAVRVLGAAELVSGDCGTTPAVLVCRRLDASAAVWPFPLT